MKKLDSVLFHLPVSDVTTDDIIDYWPESELQCFKDDRISLFSYPEEWHEGFSTLDHLVESKAL